jgi:hypothetical protein
VVEDVVATSAGTYFDRFMPAPGNRLPNARLDDGGIQDVRPCNQHIVRTLELVDDMIYLADRGDADREDTGCGILYGLLRDSAYKIKKLAEEERQRHIVKGWWPEGSKGS